MSDALSWRRTPLAVVAAIEGHEQARRSLVLAVLEQYAARIEAHMRATASWQDRTGAARESLFAEARQSALRSWELAFGFGPTIDYGDYLEFGTRFMDAYPVIGPARELFARELMRSLITAMAV